MYDVNNHDKYEMQIIFVIEISFSCSVLIEMPHFSQDSKDIRLYYYTFYFSSLVMF